MTDADDRHDDLASALLDGTLPEAAAAAARRDPAVLARMAAMAEARDRLRDVPPPDPRARDRAVAAALAAFEPAAGGPGRVADLGESRRRRRGPPRWLGAAAAVVLVVAGLAGLAVLAGDGQGGDEDVSLSAEQDAGGAASGDDASDEAGGDDRDDGAAAAPTTPEEAARAAGYLGSFASAAALADHVSDLASGDFSAGEAETAESVVPSQSTLATAACAAESLPPVLRDGDGTIELYGHADLDGAPVEVWVVSTAGGRRLVAVDPSCRTVVDEALG